MRAAGVNFADILGRTGLYAPAPPPPYVPGFEVAGVVLECGAEVVALSPGSAVIAGSRFGGYASELVAQAARVLPLPAGWRFAEGAGFFATYATAWHALVTLGRVGSGARVLVLAGAGGLGIAAIQLAHHLGARVVACAGGPDKARFCEQQGADAGVDYLVPNWPEAALAAAHAPGFDLILDSVMGRDFWAWRQLLRLRGHLVLCGAASFTPRRARNWLVLGWKWLRRPRLDLLDFVSSCRTISGFNLLLLLEEAEYVAELGRALGALAASSALRPVIDRSFRFSQAAEAHAYVQGRRTRGKVVLIPDEVEVTQGAA